MSDELHQFEGRLPDEKLGKEWRFRRSALLRSLGEPDITRPLGDFLNYPRFKT